MTRCSIPPEVNWLRDKHRRKAGEILSAIRAVESLEADLHLNEINVSDLVLEIARCRFALELVERALALRKLGLDVSHLLPTHASRELKNEPYVTPLSRTIREFLESNRGVWKSFRQITDHVIDALLPEATYADRVLLVNLVSCRLGSMRGKVHALEVRAGHRSGLPGHYRFTSDAAIEDASRARNSKHLALYRNSSTGRRTPPK